MKKYFSIINNNILLKGISKEFASSNEEMIVYLKNKELINLPEETFSLVRK